MPASYLVTNIDELKRVLWRPRGSRVVISSPRLPHVERRGIQEQMNCLLATSGYGVGAAALAAALALSTLWIGGNWQLFVAHWVVATGLGIAACLFATIIGRAIGFLYARWRLARLICVAAAKMKDFGGKECGIGARRAALMTRKTVA